MGRKNKTRGCAVLRTAYQRLSSIHFVIAVDHSVAEIQRREGSCMTIKEECIDRITMIGYTPLPY